MLKIVLPNNLIALLQTSNISELRSMQLLNLIQNTECIFVRSRKQQNL